jgi:sugar phosphate isomerase/epimerase
MRDEAPFNEIRAIPRWVADYGYLGVQIPTWDPRAIHLDQAAASRAFCEEYLGMFRELGLEPTELASQLQGPVLAMHRAYEMIFETFHPAGLRGQARTA